MRFVFRLKLLNQFNIYVEFDFEHWNGMFKSMGWGFVMCVCVWVIVSIVTIEHLHIYYHLAYMLGKLDCNLLFFLYYINYATTTITRRKKENMAMICGFNNYCIYVVFVLFCFIWMAFNLLGTLINGKSKRRRQINWLHWICSLSHHVKCIMYGIKIEYQSSLFDFLLC